MKLFYSFSWFVLITVSVCSLAAAPSWFTNYEATHLQAPQKTLHSLLAQHKALPAGTERIYLSTTASKLAHKLKLPLDIKIDATHPLGFVEQQMLDAEKLALQGYYQRSIALLNKIKSNIDESEYPELHVLILRKIIWLHIKQGNYKSLEQLTTKMNQLSEKVIDSILDSRIQLNLSALVASHNGYFDDALSLYQRILNGNPSSTSQAATFNNIGLTLMNMGQYNGAIDYFNQALEIRVIQNDTRRIALTSLNLGIAYRKSKAYSRAKPYLLKAQQLFRTLSNDYGVGNSNIQLAKLYLATNQPALSLTLLSQTIHSLDLEHYTELYFDTHIALAKSHLQLKQYDWALNAATTSLELTTRHNDIEHQLDALLVIIDIHDALKQFEQAYTFQKRYLAIVQQYTQVQNQNALVNIQRELKLTERDLHTARLEQSNLLQQHRIQELQYNQYRLWLTIACVVLIALLFWRSRNKQRYLAEHDALTGALNRTAMYKRLAKHPEPKKGTSHLFVLFDLDHFKKINDTFGHPAGDHTLIHCCKSIHSAIEQSHFIARIGGEEFVLFIPNIKPEHAYPVVEKARLSLCETPIILDDKTHITATASFAYYTSKHTEHSQFTPIYNSLDASLYQAKAQGRNCVVAAAQPLSHEKESP
ncbi:diguanylate cyclase domain-containing protein [Pseudoalteromonas sp. MSK9-3]|uniref:tetratricopeptide repeat-containing diguanylate cyclase n=1 Tax=Pseudoalteromonas sp. MSK9-3 TaxID=1897633 RepID=UPI001602444B|nr:diguanylate cyclase [Pseudoalteromonas sp. MSK9-3]